jgi:glycosyltransferase involved in cell wall biosynthesis
MTVRPLTARGRRDTVCLVGPGWRFTSGISYYTCLLANSLADHHDVSVIQMRRLLPRRLYPGRNRVGEQRSRTDYRPDVKVYDGVDWWWGPSLVRALRFMGVCRPQILVLQWWTASVLHSYLVLAVAGRMLGARVVLELHEFQDTGEGRLPLAGRYGRWGLRLLVRLAHGCVVHSEPDRDMFQAQYGRKQLRMAIAPHGPFDQYRPVSGLPQQGSAEVDAVKATPRPAAVNLLFFGTIRPYKGLEDLLTVFSSLTDEEASRLWLTVVGETWEGCTEPARLIAASPHRDRITFVNDYVPDEVVTAAFAHADVVVLPYRRSSSSGPLHIAMSWGLPVVVTRVGGLPEAADGYGGAVFVPQGDHDALKRAIWRAVQLAGHRFADPRTWADSIDAVFSAAGSKAAGRAVHTRQPEAAPFSSYPAGYLMPTEIVP